MNSSANRAARRGVRVRPLPPRITGGRGRCAGLVLVASSPFLGHLKAHLGVQAKKALVRTVDADYTALRDRELAERLAEPEGSV